MAGPLNGVRIVELGGQGPGPHSGMILGDLGADVIRVQQPLSQTGVEDDLSSAIYRNRRTIELDLKDADELETLRDLTSSADVVIEVFRPGVAERLGIGPDHLMPGNSRLIYARMTGWGQEGPLARRAGHDINYLSLTGALGAIGRKGAPPTPPLNLVGDYGGGSMFLVTGILAALIERERSGLGQVIDVAMIDGISSLMQLVWSLWSSGNWNNDRGSNLFDSGAPFYDVYECADGRYMAVGALEEKFYTRLVEGLGLDVSELPDRHDSRNWLSIRGKFQSAFGSRSRDKWTSIFDEIDACVTPVLDLHEAARDPHITFRETIVSVDGTLQAAPAPRFSRSQNDRFESGRMISPEMAIEEWRDKT